MWKIPHWSTIVVSTLVVFFVLGSWLNLSGVWIEFPLIVNELPEGWRLPAVMGLVANLANIGVLIIAVIRRFSRGRVTYEIPTNIFILGTGTVVLVIIAFVWNKTTIINGTPHSSYLMGLSLTLSLVDCTSSVTFLPFLDRYEPIYINAYFLGESLSSLFPALLGIAQGVGRTLCLPNANGTLVESSSPPRFSVRTYFLALSVIMLASLLSFIILCLTRTGRRQDTPVAITSTAKFVPFGFLGLLGFWFVFRNVVPVVEMVQVQDQRNELQSTDHMLLGESRMTTREFWFSQHGLHLFLCFWTSILIMGRNRLSWRSCSLYRFSSFQVLLPVCKVTIKIFFFMVKSMFLSHSSLQGFSLYPYSIEVYHHTIIACQFAYPLMSLLGAFTAHIRSRYLYPLTLIGTGLFAYTFTAAKLSPCSPLVDHVIGRILIALAWVSKYCVLYYVRVLLGNYFRRTSGHRGLFWFGVLTQVGSLIGAVIIYIFTEHLYLFRERKICLSYSC